MTLVITHTGQTGVERGADRAARAVGFGVGGCTTPNTRDELGRLPAELIRDLTPCDRRGARSALLATLDRSHSIIIGVPDASRANLNPGIPALRGAARQLGIPHRIVDPITDLDLLARELRVMERDAGQLRVMVTGPRLTRWSDGERFGWSIVAAISLAPSLSAHRRILVVDDQQEVVEASTKLLRMLGHECVAATSGAACLEVAASFAPEIVLLDIRLPDMDGYEVARRLRQAQTQPLFLAAVTGCDRASDRESLAAGFDRHIVKPTSAETIHSLVSEADHLLAS